MLRRARFAPGRVVEQVQPGRSTRPRDDREQPDVRVVRTVHVTGDAVIVGGGGANLRRVAEELSRRAKEAVRLRLAARKRWLHKQVDPDAKKWKEIADSRFGLPLDRPELVHKDDKLTDAEKLSMELVDFDRETDYMEMTGKKVIKDEARPGLRILFKIYFKETMTQALPCGMLLFQWGYFLLAQQCMAFFDCQSDREQKRLVSDPTVICYKGNHLAHLILAIIGLIIYLANFVRPDFATTPSPKVSSGRQDNEGRHQEGIAHHAKRRYRREEGWSKKRPTST